MVKGFTQYFDFGRYLHQKLKSTLVKNEVYERWLSNLTILLDATDLFLE
jgi:hypothetical protein